MSLSTSTDRPPPPLESRAVPRGPSAAAGAHTTTLEGEGGCGCCHAHGAAHPNLAPTSARLSSAAAPPSTPTGVTHRGGGQDGTYAAGTSSSSPSPSTYRTPFGRGKHAAGASSSASPLSPSSMWSPNQSFFAFGQLRQDMTSACPEQPSFSFVAPPSPFSSPAASLSSPAHPSPLPTLRFNTTPSPRTANNATHAFPQPDFDAPSRGDAAVASRLDMQAPKKGTTQETQQAGETEVPSTTRADDDGPRLSSHTRVHDADGDVIMNPTPSTASPPDSPSRDHHTSPRRKKRVAVNDGRGGRAGGDIGVGCDDTVPCETGGVVLESGANGNADEYNKRAHDGGARDVDEYESENDMLAMLGEDQKEALLDALARWAVQGEYPDRPVQPLHGPRRRSMSAAGGGGGGGEDVADGGDGGSGSAGEGVHGRSRSAEGGDTYGYDSVATADPRAAIDSADDWLEATGLGGILPREMPVPAAVFSDDKDLELCGTEELLPEPVTVEQLMEGLEKLGIMAEGKEG